MGHQSQNWIQIFKEDSASYHCSKHMIQLHQQYNITETTANEEFTD